MPCQQRCGARNEQVATAARERGSVRDAAYTEHAPSPAPLDARASGLLLPAVVPAASLGLSRTVPVPQLADDEPSGAVVLAAPALCRAVRRALRSTRRSARCASCPRCSSARAASRAACCSHKHAPTRMRAHAHPRPHAPAPPPTHAPARHLAGSSCRRRRPTTSRAPRTRRDSKGRRPRARRGLATRPARRRRRWCSVYSVVRVLTQ